MRKIYILFLVSAVILFNVFVFTSIVGKPGNDFTVLEIKGDVEIKLPKGKWQVPTQNMILPEGTEISTGYNSSIKLKSQNSHMEVKPLTQIKIDKNSIENGVYNTHIKLDFGKVSAKIDKLEGTKNEFNVQTPTAVAGVRGTEEEIGYTDDLGTEIELIEGSADLMPVDESTGEVMEEQVTTVAEEQEAEVTDEGEVIEAIEIIEEEAEVDIVPEGVTEEEEEAIEEIATAGMTEFDEDEAAELMDEIIEEDYAY
ncbi:MAG: FecR family protein [Candidatus Hydrogenedentota bacterium]